MKIRVAILEKDEIYLKRMEAVFNVKYSDRVEIYSFTEKDIAIRTLNEKKIDVFLADEIFEIETGEIPSNCGFAYLVESSDIETIRNIAAVCKFQKADLIYRQILGLFSEKASEMTGVHDGKYNNKLLAFVPVSGGTGSSIAAAACAMNFSQKGKRTLYLNLEKLGSADLFFHADGNNNLGDVIYALKSKKGNLAYKIESAVKQDDSGVFFYSPTKLALDIAELSQVEIKQILDILKLSENYDYIILDLNFSMDKNFLEILEQCHTVVFVTDGSQISNGKLERAIESLHIIEQQSDMRMLRKSGILYNRFSSKTSSKAAISELKEFGGIKKYEGFDTEMLLRQLKTEQVFDALEQENDER